LKEKFKNREKVENKWREENAWPEDAILAAFLTGFLYVVSAVME